MIKRLAPALALFVGMASAAADEASDRSSRYASEAAARSQLGINARQPSPLKFDRAAHSLQPRDQCAGTFGEALAVACLSAEDPRGRIRAITLLGRSRDVCEFASMLERCSDQDARVRIACINALRQDRCSSAASIKVIEEAMRSPSVPERTLAVSALSTAPVPTAAPLLLDALQDAELGVRLRAVELLSDMGPHLPEEGFHALAVTAKDKDYVGSYVDDERGIVLTNSDLRAAAIHALARQGQRSKAVSSLFFEALWDRNPNVRKSAGYALTRSYGERSLLTKILRYFYGDGPASGPLPGRF